MDEELAEPYKPYNVLPLDVVVKTARVLDHDGELVELQFVADGTVRWNRDFGKNP